MTTPISRTGAKTSAALALALLCVTLLSACASLARPGGLGGDVDLVRLWSEANDAYVIGNYEAARTHYEKLVKAAPENVLALVRLGNIDYRMGDLAGARSHYQQALRVEPRQPQVHYNLAMVELSIARRHLGAYLTASDAPAAGLPVSELMTAIDRFAGMSDAVTQGSTDMPSGAPPEAIVAAPVAGGKDDENE